MEVREASSPRRQKAAIREVNEKAILEAAEVVFAEYGYAGASTGRIAELAGIPKANLHYYFPTKEGLYRRIIENIFNVWLEAAGSFDASDDPVEALTRYIRTKMELSRTHPMGSKIWANEIIQRAPIIQDYLETTLRDWTATRVAAIEGWIAEGKLAKVEPHYLLYMIWATTQHYADFCHQITTLNGGRDLSEEQWETAKDNVTTIILRGVKAIP